MVKGKMEHRFPAVLGKDFAGTVEAIGDGVTSVAVGDPVFGVLMRDYVGDGTFAEFAVIPEAIGLARIPAGLEPAVAGVLGLAGAAAKGSIEAIAPGVGETVLISGATGGAGAVAIQLARGAGAEVIATARPGEEELVKDLGATHVVDYTGYVGGQVRRIWPKGVEAVVHLAGDAKQLADLAVAGGRFASTLGVGPEQLDGGDLKATAVMAMPTADVLHGLASAVARGDLRIPIQRRYDLPEVARAIDDFTKGTFGKLAITI
jgi:NADPH:quinone reductase-like Zn-dependent oxidoreductase